MESKKKKNILNILAEVTFVASASFVNYEKFRSEFIMDNINIGVQGVQTR